MSTPPTLEDVLTGLAVPDPMDRSWLIDEMLPAFGIGHDTLMAQTLEDVLLADARTHSSKLEVRPGGWTVNIAGSVAKAVLATALVAAGLAAAGRDDVPAELIPAVLPLVVDLAKVRLDRKERALLLPLRLATSGLAATPVHPQVVYDRLEPAVRAQLNYNDFLTFCERLIAAGELDDGGYGDIQARPGGPAWVRITFT
ncbi:hypothetical protein GCM10027517_11820 [Phycicoccus ginsengisoli]